MKKILLCIIILGGLLLVSCENDNEKIIKSDKQYQVTKAEAMKFAINFVTKMSSHLNNYQRSFDIIKTIKEASELKATNQENSIYIINFNEGGFVIMSADNRATPILAYSETDDFKLDINELPEPVKDWILNENDRIDYVKENNVSQSLEVKTEWDFVEKVAPINPPGGGGVVCNDFYMQKGPLLNTYWGQTCTYNNLLPDCSSPDHCGKVYTGCVATAMAQIMKYWHKPNSYNWSNMPSDFGTISTQTLMQDIGQAFSMNYGCSKSGANNSNIVPAFNSMGYSASLNCTYQSDIVRQQIDWNKPVILTGGRKKDGWSWTTYTDGHAWVSDGYQYMEISYLDQNNTCQSSAYMFLHMNWGWEGGYLNGWFNAWNFNPGNLTFNYQKAVIFNINPN